MTAVDLRIAPGDIVSMPPHHPLHDHGAVVCVGDHMALVRTVDTGREEGWPLRLLHVVDRVADSHPAPVAVAPRRTLLTPWKRWMR